MAENNYLTEDNELPSELITKKAESLGIDRGTFQTVYPQIRKSLTDRGVEPNDANLGILLDMNSRDARNSAPQQNPAQAQVRETMANQADLNKSIPWADSIDEAYGPQAMEEYNVKIKEWEKKVGPRKALTDNLANIGDIARPGGNNLYDQNQQFYQNEANKIKRDTVDLQAGKQKLLSDKTGQINASRASSQAGLKDLADNTGLSLQLQGNDPNSDQSKYYRKLARSILPDFSPEELANAPAGLIQQLIAFKQSQNKLTSEQSKLMAEVEKAQAEAGKAGAEASKASAETGFTNAKTNLITGGNNGPGGIPTILPEGVSVNPVAVEAAKQNLGLGQKQAILKKQIDDMNQVIKDAEKGGIDFGKIQLGTDPSLGASKPNIINSPAKVAANERADNIMIGENYVQALKEGGRGLSEAESNGIKATFPTRTLAKDEYLDRAKRLRQKLLIEYSYNQEKLDSAGKSKKSSGAAPTTVNSKAEYDSLPSGTAYTYKGKSAIKP